VDGVSGVDELIAFLRACLDDDERVARAASPAPWSTYPEDDGGMIGPSMSGMHTPAYVHTPDAEHIARWDPARVLAEVEAERRILNLHGPGGPSQLSYACASNCLDDRQLTQERPCATVLALAQPYAGRPGWREEWTA
jgi:hypothetical protein